MLHVAVKVLLVDGKSEDLLVKFFKRESDALETMRRLKTPHLIKAYAAFTKDNGRGSHDRGFIFPVSNKTYLSICMFALITFLFNTAKLRYEGPFLSTN